MASFTHRYLFSRLVGVDFKFPSLNVTYWGSFEQEVGFEITICSGLLSVAYQVTLTDIFN